MRSSPSSHRSFAILYILALACVVHGRKLEVGPGKALAKPSAAAVVAQKGDTVEIAAGSYPGDVATWSVDNLTLRAPSAFAHLEAAGANAGGKAIWVISGANSVVENIEFSGATVPDGNGAGIRLEGLNSTIRNCFFHDNEDGILTGSGNSEIVIEGCEFARNGAGDGYTHNMYIGTVASFTLRHCYSHEAKVGHNVKSRALRNYILYNRISDGAEGTASYSIDLPDGGLAFVIGNAVQKGPKAENPVLLTFGEESLKNAGSALYAVNNTFVSDRSNGTFVRVAAGTPAAKVLNNLFVGGATPLSGPADTAANLATNAPGLVDRAGFDYRLTEGSAAVGKAKDPGQAGGMELKPVEEYAHPLSGRARASVGALDIGAYEFGSGAAIRPYDGKSGKGGKALPCGGEACVDALGRDSRSPGFQNHFFLTK